MVKKKIDSRVRGLLQAGVKNGHRSFIVLVGDRGRDQVVNLHYILSKLQVKQRPDVLWCYKKELGFSTHRKKRMKQVKKLIKRGLYDPDKDNPFDVFISSTNIRYCYYKETHNILGRTFGMCVLQDFEALSPNILCRTIETVEGGGLVVLLLNTMKSLKQLYTMTMDVHSRFRTAAHQDVVPRFNERFILSLASCDSTLVLDDELNVLPISLRTRTVGKINNEEERAAVAAKLEDLKQELQDVQPVGSLVDMCRTQDQARLVMTCVEAIAEKTLRSTAIITASRGRGKSAALGLAIAAAVSHGYSNIFVTSPSPENLGTLFEFLLKGLDKLAYVDHQDYDVVQSTNPDYHKAVVRVNIFKSHRQTVQYVAPGDASMLAQAELLCIDEAAAIPLPLVKKLFGPYLIFMSSTVTGYEGTGRSLSMKLVRDLRKRQANKSGATSSAGRQLKEVHMDEPIRYAINDPIEAWLNDLLCLDVGGSGGAEQAVPRQFRLQGACPAPEECELYAVNREALFSYHSLSENFLKRMMHLYVSSHYKNSPNDLQLMSDAPAHRLFALLAPMGNDDDDDDDDDHSGDDGGRASATGGDRLPDILCVVQVALEGSINRESVQAALRRGVKSAGDLIPWTVAQQFQDHKFASLSGARVVRIAVHPDATRMGYGSRAIELLRRFYQGELHETDTDDVEDEVEEAMSEEEAEDDSTVKPRAKLPPLLVPLADKRPERLHWLGVSFGISQQLFHFWSRAGFKPMYLRQTPSPTTGEHTTVMVQALACSDLPLAPQAGWLDDFVADFQGRLVSLLSYKFRDLPVALALSLLRSAASAFEEGSGNKGRLPELQSAADLANFFRPHDYQRLKAYSRNMVDHHLVVDLVPTLAQLYFKRRFGDSVQLSTTQSVILLAQGLQYRSMSEIGKELDLPTAQVVALYNKAMRKFSARLLEIQKEEIESESAETDAAVLRKAAQAEERAERGDQVVSLGEAQEKAASEAKGAMRSRMRNLLKTMDLSEYNINAADSDWNEALRDVDARALGSGQIALPRMPLSSAADDDGDDDGKNLDLSGGGGANPQKKHGKNKKLKKSKRRESSGGSSSAKKKGRRSK